jgi:hypothetical protein
MADELSEREQALRRLPLPYSLALRLRDAGVATDVICQYVNVEQAALDGLYGIAEAKLMAAAKGERGPLLRVALTHADPIRLVRARQRQSFPLRTTRDRCRPGRGQAGAQDRD